MRLGRMARPWVFLPAASAMLALEPGDVGLRFLAAANLARLGLRTLAGEMLDGLPEAVREHPDVRTLDAALSGLPRDRVEVDWRAQVLARNAAALRRRAVDVSSEADAWRERAAMDEVYRCLDGNLVWRRIDSPRGVLGVRSWRDDRGTAAEAVRRALLDGAGAGGVVVEGVNPPWTLMEAWGQTKDMDAGTRVTVVADRLEEVVAGLTLADLGAVLADGRVEVLLGEGAGRALGVVLGARLDTVLPRCVVVNPGSKGRVTPAVERTLAEAHAAQANATPRWSSGRDRAWWAGRYARIKADGSGRVLIPSTRRSTFTQYAAEDLAGAFERAGWTAVVLREADGYSRLSNAGLARAVGDVAPDLIVSINTPRVMLGDACPVDVPLVTWVQDARGEVVGGTADPLAHDMDFVAGHVFEGMRWDAGRVCVAGVPASAAKFHDGPVHPGLAGKHTCDLMHVSHGSETPAAMHVRLVHEVGDARMRRVFDLLERDVRGVVARADRVRPMEALREIVSRRVREVLGRSADARTEALTLHLYAAPMAERMFRHEMLGWAAEAARAMRLRFHLYGRGWESHPTLGAFAKGPLAHAEELRAAYRSAGVNLHASIFTLTHQRVLECALSGGYTACRMQFDALAAPASAALTALLGRAPDVEDGARVGYRVDRHAEAREAAAWERAFGGRREGDVVWIDDPGEVRRDAGRRAAGQNARLVLGDEAGYTFMNADEFARLVERMVTDGPHRRVLSDRQHSGALAHGTHDVLVARMVGMIRCWLGVEDVRG